MTIVLQQSNTEFLFRMYETHGRTPGGAGEDGIDDPGFQFWLSQLESGTSRNLVQEAFLEHESSVLTKAEKEAARFQLQHEDALMKAFPGTGGADEIQSGFVGGLFTAAQDGPDLIIGGNNLPGVFSGDVLLGGAGNDTIVGGPGDAVVGGPGEDTIIFSPVNFTGSKLDARVDAADGEPDEILIFDFFGVGENPMIENFVDIFVDPGLDTIQIVGGEHTGASIGFADGGRVIIGDTQITFYAEVEVF